LAGQASRLAGQQPAGARPRNWPDPPKKSDRSALPNILWVCSDQQRFDTIEGLNNSHVHTPSLRKFMAEATTFTHAMVQNPVCSPSRASFLTGRYPHVTGLRANGQRIRADERLVTRILADNGYECGLVGKLHLSPCAGGRLEDRIDDGYHRFEWSHDWSDGWPGHNMWRVYLERNSIRFPKPAGDPWGVPIEPKYTQTAWCSLVAQNFMREQRNFAPWLMSVNIFQPHHPFWPAKDFLDRFDPAQMPKPAYQAGELDSKPVYQRVDHQGAYAGSGISFARMGDGEHLKVRAAYYAMIEQVDDEFGKMMKVLENTGQADNTIVIFMSDHGEMLGDHGFYLKGPHFYDCAMRVPLMIRWPGKFKAGLRSDALVEMVDLAPTLLEAAGIPVPPGMQGQSLMPLLTGRTTEHRDSQYAEHYDSSFLYDPPPMATCVRTGRSKMTMYHTLKSGELYDLEKDPQEFRNLWNDPNARDLKEQMSALMIERMAGMIDPLPVRRSVW
jgi:arylsulfatase A-like enzyme